MYKLIIITASLIWIVLASPFKDACTVTSYNALSHAVSSCKNIVIEGITVPSGKTLDLSKLKSGATVTFQGTTTFAKCKWKGPLVKVGGKKITIKGAPGSKFDGLGAEYWDREGDEGCLKPKFFKIKTEGSILENIHLVNCPHQCVSISSSNTILDKWTIDVSAGDKAGGKNTDGFDISWSTNLTIKNSVVKNQDDCVAVNQGSNLMFKNLTCSGGHGLSLSVGESSSSGSGNTVENVVFSDCTVLNSRNGIHVKTHCDAGTGWIKNIFYENIKLSGITNYGISIQQDYSKGKSTGNATNNIPISKLNLRDVTGSMKGISGCMPVYILCGSKGCSNWDWSGVSVSNGKHHNECNFHPSGFHC